MGVSPWTNPQQQIATSILYICMSKLYPTEINSQISNKPSLQWFPLPTSIYGATCVRSLRFAQTSRDISIQIPGMRLIWPKWARLQFLQIFRQIGRQGAVEHGAWTHHHLSSNWTALPTLPTTNPSPLDTRLVNMSPWPCQVTLLASGKPWRTWWCFPPRPGDSKAKDHHPSARKEIKVNWFKFNIC